jgi:hypothetical protein
VAGKDYISAVTKELPAEVTDLSVGRPQSGVYFFLSFDLVNSTKFKAQKENAYWPMVVNQFYEISYKEVRKVEHARVWKYVGDEVLFYKRLASIADLEQTMANAFRALRGTISSLHGTFPTTRTQLSVKATCWVAPMAYIPPDTLEAAQQKYLKEGSAPGAGEQFPRNIIVQVPYGSSRSSQLDFLGPDIDAGFRITKFTEKGLLTVSADIAWVIRAAGTGLASERLRVVGYRQLKGVWADRYYPIVWYHDPWEDLQFDYDQRFSNDLIAAVADGPAAHIKELERVYAQRGDQDAKSVLEVLKASEANREDVEPRAPAEMEVHCVAVCFNADGHILIAKRPAEKRVAPNAWEFGCSQLRAGLDFLDCIREDYRADFGAQLEFFYDQPFRKYVIDKLGHKVPGVIFVALVTNPEAVLKEFSKEKHSEVRWLDPSKIDVEDASCVPDFRGTVQQAVVLWRAYRPRTDQVAPEKREPPPQQLPPREPAKA